MTGKQRPARHEVPLAVGETGFDPRGGSISSDRISHAERGKSIGIKIEARELIADLDAGPHLADGGVGLGADVQRAAGSQIEVAVGVKAGNLGATPQSQHADGAGEGDLGGRSRQIGRRGDGDGEATAFRSAIHELGVVATHHGDVLGTTLEGDQGHALGQSSAAGLDGVHASLKSLDLGLQVGEVVSLGAGSHDGHGNATQQSATNPLGIGHWLISHNLLAKF